jgi:hypothetical protein
MAKGKTRIIVRRAAGFAGRGLRRAGRAAREDKDMLAAPVAAYIVGRLEMGGSLKSVPNITGDPVTDLGILFYVAHKFKMGGKWSRTGAIAALSVGAYRKATSEGATVKGDADEEVLG